jgi:tetratricopeptide (TPR) repeat protein
MNKIHSLISSLEAEKLMQKGNYREALELLSCALKENNASMKENVLSNISICHLYFQEYDQAKNYLEKLVMINPENCTALYNLAYSYVSLGKYEEAIHFFEELKKKEAINEDIAYNLGMAYLKTRFVDKAMESFYFLTEKTDGQQLIYNIGLTLMQMNYPEKARDLFVKRLAKDNQDNHCLFGLGIAYSRLLDFRKAIECLERVISRDPSHYPGAYISLAVAYFQIGFLEKSIEKLNTVISIQSDIPEAWYYLGWIYESCGQIDKAVESLNKARQLSPNNLEIWEGLGGLYLKTGHYYEASTCFKKAFQLSQDTKYAYKTALIFFLQKEYQKAIPELLLCLSEIESCGSFRVKDFSREELWKNLALCYYYTHQYQESVQFGVKFLKNSELPGAPMPDSMVYFVAGNSLMKLGQFEKARDYLSRGLKIKPKDLNLLYSLGTLEGRLGNFEKAEDYLENALSFQRNPDILYALALTKMKLKKNEASIKLLEEYQKFQQINPKVLYKLGLFYLHLKDRIRAKAAFKKVISLEPGNKKAQEYLKSLGNVL